MTPNISGSELDYALRANITLHTDAYEYRGGMVKFIVREDADGDYRCVSATAHRDADGDSRISGGFDGARLTPTWTERLRERLTGWEYEPVSESEQIRRACAVAEGEIDRIREAEERHDDCTVESGGALRP